MKRVPAPLVASAPPDARRALALREADVDEATQAVAEARREVRRAELLRFQAEQRLDELSLALEGAREVARRARKLGLSQLVRDAAVEANALDLQRTAALRALDLADAEVELAERTVRLRKAQRNLAEAELEVARAQAARASSAPEAQNVALSEYQGQLADAHARMAKAQSAAARQTRSAQKARDRLAAAEAALPPEADLENQLVRVRAERDALKSRVDLLATQVVDLHERLKQTRTSTTR